jgi:hypothetical protein
MDAAVAGAVPHVREAAGDQLMGESSAMHRRTDTADERTRRANRRLGFILLTVALVFFVGVFVSRLF